MAHILAPPATYVYMRFAVRSRLCQELMRTLAVFVAYALSSLTQAAAFDCDGHGTEEGKR
jgi:hypothetical protein